MSKSKDSLSSTVKSYLVRTNRPFSATDVFNNLNTKDNKLSKTAVFKTLDELASRQEIQEKVNGKQKVYFADQNNFDTIDDKQMKELDLELNQLDKEVNQLQDKVKLKETRLSTHKNCLTSEQISGQLSELKAEIKDLHKRLDSIDSKAKDFDPKENQKLKTDRQKLVTEWRKRKRMATNMVDMILESYPKPKKALLEEIGLETDEELKVSLPQI